jgi:hypothetical protein
MNYELFDSIAVVTSYGFSEARSGGHMARSMMLQELRMLLDATAKDADRAAYATAIVTENALGKPTHSSRKKSLEQLVKLYGLNPELCLFRQLRNLAEEEPSSLPLLALVLAFCRDTQLRQSFELIRDWPMGAVVKREAMERHLEACSPGRYSPAMIKSLSQNVLTTWKDSGHLHGRITPKRSQPTPTMAASVFAMLAGYLAGLRGEGLLTSDFGKLVAPDAHVIQSHLSSASGRGWMRFRRAGGVTEIDFTPMLTPRERDGLHESH